MQTKRKSNWRYRVSPWTGRWMESRKEKVKRLLLAQWLYQIWNRSRKYNWSFSGEINVKGQTCQKIYSTIYNSDLWLKESEGKLYL